MRVAHSLIWSDLVDTVAQLLWDAHFDWLRQPWGDHIKNNTCVGDITFTANRAWFTIKTSFYSKKIPLRISDILRSSSSYSQNVISKTHKMAFLFGNAKKPPFYFMEYHIALWFRPQKSFKSADFSSSQQQDQLLLTPAKLTHDEWEIIVKSVKLWNKNSGMTSDNIHLSRVAMVAKWCIMGNLPMNSQNAPGGQGRKGSRSSGNAHS